MRILSIVWYKVLPAKFGGQKGIAHFNQSLASHYPLTCLCSSNNEPPADINYKVLPELPESKWQFFLPSCWRKIKSTAIREKATHIILEHPYHAIAAVKASKATHAKLIVHSHNIEHERFRQMKKWGWRLLRQYEKWVHRKADLSLFKTEEDRQWAIQYFGLPAEKCMTIPYGVEKPAKNTAARGLIRERHKLLKEEKILLFAGTLDYSPNAKAVEDIYSQVAPLLVKNNIDHKIIICGRNRFPSFQYLKKLSHPSVIYAGEVEDIENYFSAADTFINPVRDSGGIQTKNIDALSYGLPVVCFRNVMAGLAASLCPGKVFEVAENDWNDFAAAVTRAVHSPLAETPPPFFAHYSFDAQAEKLATRLISL